MNKKKCMKNATRQNVLQNQSMLRSEAHLRAIALNLDAAGDPGGVSVRNFDSSLS